MSKKKEYLNILTQLAMIDGEVVESEIELIRQLGKAHELTEQDIQDCFDHPSPIPNLDALSDDQRFEYIYNIVKLMKIDGKIFQEEIRFCSKMASRLGYDEAVLFELITKIYADERISEDKEVLKSKVQRYLHP